MSPLYTLTNTWMDASLLRRNMQMTGYLPDPDRHRAAVGEGQLPKGCRRARRAGLRGDRCERFEGGRSHETL